MTGKQRVDQGPDQEGAVRIVLLANQPRMFREMLHRVLDKTPGVRLTLEIAELNRIADILARVEADWLIVSLDEHSALPSPVKEVMVQNPILSVLGISNDGSHVEIEAINELNEKGLEREHYSLDNISLADLFTILGDKETS